jgi:mRNA interferase MazF
MLRGEIWWADLPTPVGSEPGYRRPIVIIQDDTFTQSNLRTVIAIVITSNLELARSPGNVLLSSRKTGLPKDSVANVSQVLTIDKSFLTERIGSIPGNLQDEIDEGLRMILYL